MTELRIGSLFSGYGGLDLAVESVLDARTVWTCDLDPGARRILRHRFPGVPNLGDITAVDWATVEPVDVLTGGFPCQDVSHAGARKGLGPGTRSGLWARMADAIDHLRPALVVFENVRGLLSASAASDVEPCPWCMGGAGDGEPALRALGSVLADLAELGYDAAWHSVRAADVGAPHGRFRVFGLAWPAAHAEHPRPRRETDDARGRESDPAGRPSGSEPRGSRAASGSRSPAIDAAAGDAGRVSVQRRADPRGVAGTPRTGESEGIQRERRRDTPRDASADAPDTHGARLEGGEQRGSSDNGPSVKGSGADADTDGIRPKWTGRAPAGRGPRSADNRRRAVPDAAGDGRDEGRAEPAGIVGRSHAADSGAAAAADTGREHGQRRQDEVDGSARQGRPPSEPERLASSAADSDRDGRESGRVEEHARVESAPGREPVGLGDHGQQWGAYEPVIRRWEHALGRVAPAPTELSPQYVAMVARRRARLDPRPVGRRGSLRPVRRLSPRFVEWLMGLPDGWVTQVPGLSRNDQLKALGNGVVPQQAAAALRTLLAWQAAAVGEVSVSA